MYQPCSERSGRSSRRELVASRFCAAPEASQVAAICSHAYVHKAPCSKEPSSRAKERRVDTRTTLIHAACWHLSVLSMPAAGEENLARRHKECCKMTYSRMAFSSRGPSSPRAAANRRDWHQASWWVMVEQWMDGGAAGCSSPSKV